MKHVYVCIYAMVEDGKVIGYNLDADDYHREGHVWDSETGEWSTDIPVEIDQEVWSTVLKRLESELVE